MTDPLLSEFSLGSVALRNRVVMAPMTREKAAAGVPTVAMTDYYRRRAAKGVALILTEGTPPDSSGAFSSAVPRFYGDAALRGWARIAAAVHEEGAAIFAQLWHVGGFNPSLIGMADSETDAPGRLSPSGIAGPGVRCGRQMASNDIDRTIDAYATAAAAARRLGFDGVEIHGAHGYLPDQFLWKQTNLRNDAYGGSEANRARFAAEIVAECRARCGARFPISFRFSQWKQLDYAARIAETPAELGELLLPLVDAGVTVFHASTRRYWEPVFPGSELSLAAWTKKLTGLPVIAVGSVTLDNDFKSELGKVTAQPEIDQVALLNRCIDRGDFDLIAIGRALLANPDWVEIVRDNRLADLRPFSRALLDDLV